MLKTTFDSTTYHLNLSPMFLNCLLLDLTVIYLMSIVHMVKIWVEIAKKIEMRTSGGRGVFSDCRHPRTRGEGGGQKRANFCGRPLWMAPYNILNLELIQVIETVNELLFPFITFS